MLEIWSAAISPVNLPLTVLLGVILLFWVTVIAGALDADIFHIDMDVDADMDVDVDVHADIDAHVDVHTDAHAEVGAHGLGYSVLHFFNVGEVPVMVLISFLVLSMWMISMAANQTLHNHNFFISAALWVPNFIVSAFVAKIASTPFRFIFKALGKDAGTDHRDLTGMTCKVLSPKVTAEKIGQGNVATKGSPYTLNIIATKGETLKKGDEAVILEEDLEKNLYTVKKLDMDGI